jgi:hypothetical protein
MRAVSANASVSIPIGSACEREVIGQRQEHFLGRERNMQEKSDPVGDPEFAQLRAQRDEVIVVHPDDVVRTQQRKQRFGEIGVDALVASERGPAELDQAKPVMAERPERAVGVADIIRVVVVL